MAKEYANKVYGIYRNDIEVKVNIQSHMLYNFFTLAGRWRGWGFFYIIPTCLYTFWHTIPTSFHFLVDIHMIIRPGLPPLFPAHHMWGETRLWKGSQYKPVVQFKAVDTMADTTLPQWIVAWWNKLKVESISLLAQDIRQNSLLRFVC